MRSLKVVLTGGPAAIAADAARLSDWVVIVLIVATLILSLIQAVMPQDSNDRLQLLMTLIRPRSLQPGDPGPGINQTGAVILTPPEKLDGMNSEPGRQSASSRRRRSSRRSRENARGDGKCGRIACRRTRRAAC